MTRSPAISALLILTLCIVAEVLSAPREKIEDQSRLETFAETREDEVSQSIIRMSRASRNERFDVSREDEMRPRKTRLVGKEPLQVAKKDEKEAETKKPIVEKPKDNSPSISEAKDMTNTHVAPKDDEDDAVAESKKKNSASDEETTNKNTTQAPLIFPTDNVKTPETDPKAYEKLDKAFNSPKKPQADPKNVSEVSSPSTASSDSTSSTVSVTAASVTSETPTSPQTSEATAKTPSVPAETIPTTVETNPPTTQETTTVSMTPTIGTTTVAPTEMTESTSVKNDVITEKSMTIGATEKYSSKAEEELHTKKPKSMPSGIVALITAISFAIVAVTAYIGLLAWRRYHEWRYGNRELLVNEFDSNDIGNFEL